MVQKTKRRKIMPIIKELSFNDFKKEFEDYNRDKQFSLQGLSALYDYVLELSDESGENYKLDVIELCTTFTEYESISQALKEYDLSTYHQLAESTVILPLDDGNIIIQNF